MVYNCTKNSIICFFSHTFDKQTNFKFINSLFKKIIFFLKKYAFEAHTNFCILYIDVAF